MGWELVASPQLNPLNNPACLLHWRVLLTTLRWLDRTQQGAVREYLPVLPGSVMANVHSEGMVHSRGNLIREFTKLIRSLAPETGPHAKRPTVSNASPSWERSKSREVCPVTTPQSRMARISRPSGDVEVPPGRKDFRDSLCPKTPDCL
jgi:hypothetical protein